MIRRVATILILASLLLALTTVSALARKSPEKARVSHEAISRVIEYSMPDEHNFIWGDGSTQTTVGAPLYSDRATHAGEEMGVSFYEYQHNSSMHRQIARGSDGSGGAADHTIHFEWMYLASEVLVDRSPNYAYYDAVGGVKSPPIDPTPAGEYGGYVSMDVTPDNRAVLSAHNNQGAGYEMQVWWQLSPNFSFFTASARVPRTITNVGNTGGTGEDGEVVWPAMTHQIMPGGDQVTHLIASAFGAGGSGGSSFHYVRGVNAETVGDGAWVQGWMDPTGWRDIVDTIHSGEGWDITSDNSGRVAIVWVNNLPDPAEACAGGDTCSNNNSIGGGRDRWDNDLYLQTSDDYGVSWNMRQNITKKVVGTDGFRPFADLSSMFTSDGVYHVAYVAMKWEEANQGLYASRVHHWSEGLGYPDGGGVDQGPYAGFPGNIRTVGVADWDPVNCTPGAFNENAAKLSIAECDTRLYVMWVELNSPKTSGNADQDDCAARAWNGQTGGAANGDLLLAVSGNLTGLTWDASRSITDSYGGAGGVPGPGAACDGDVIGGGTPCPAEHWPSMTEQGSAKTINMAEVTTPTLVLNNLDPGWTGTNYLDISYMDDPDPGGAIMGQGTWQEAQVRWIRIPCVTPVQAAGFAMNPNNFKFPQWVKNCEEDTVNVLIENTGNVTLTYVATPIEDPGPYSGWLSISNFSGSVPDGLNNKETGQIHLNTGGTICNVGSSAKVTGRVEFNHNASRAINNFEIELIVADTVVPVGYDTVTTSCFSLIVGNNGNAGNQGQGGVNLDWEALDWKTGMDAYLYDGGTVIAEKTDLGGGVFDTTVNWGLFQVGIADSLSVIPLGGQSKTNVGWAQMFNTGVYVTNDSAIAMVSEFYAPLDADSCNIIIKRTMVYSNDGANHLVTVGEAADYDIPNDSNNSYNSSGDGSDPVFTETGAQLIFLQGVDFLGDPYDTAQSNNGGWDAAERYGVLQYLGGQLITGGVDTTEAFPTASGMYSASNPRWVYPYDLGFDPDSLYTIMSFTGSNISDSVQDLHVGASYVFEYDLQATDTVVFCLAYITNLNASTPYASKATSGIAGSVIKAGALYTNHFEIPSTGCCVMPGDFNGDGQLNISDLSGPTSMVGFMFQGTGVGPACAAEGDFNGDGQLNISDLSGPTSMVGFMFQGTGVGPVCGPE